MKKNVKDSSVNIRISSQDKAKYTQEAKEYGMDFSKYIMHLLAHKGIRVVSDSKEIAQAMYDLNNTLNNCAFCPAIPTAEIREILSEGIARLRKAMECD